MSGEDNTWEWYLGVSTLVFLGGCIFTLITDENPILYIGLLLMSIGLLLRLGD